MGPIAQAVGVDVTTGRVQMEEDDALTVQEALAFIDAFEHDVTTDAGASSAAPTSPESSASDRPAAEADKKKRNSLAVRRCQRRKKQELLELREQVKMMEVQLKQLQRARRQQRSVSFDTSRKHKRPVLADMEAAELNGDSKAVWMRLAQRELLERQRSEMLNHQLRAAVAKHRDLSAAFQSIVGVGSINAHQLESLIDDPPAPPLYSSPKKVFCMDYVLADLQLAMEKLHIDADSVLSPINIDLGNKRGENCVEVKQSPDHGEYVEISQAYVVPQPMETIARAMWHGICTHNIQTEMYYIKVRSSSDIDAHKNYEMLLHDPARAIRYTLDGISYMKKFEEEDRRLFAFTSLVTIPGLAGINFREKSWMQLTRSPDDPSARSVLRTCYHLYPEAPALMKPSTFDSPFESELRRTRSFLLQAITTKVRTDGAKIQQLLFSQAR